MTRAISPSSLARIHACPASAALPHAPDTTSIAAEYGRAVHAGIARDIVTGTISKPGVDIRAEVKLAHDWRYDRSRFIHLPGEREYGELAPTEIAGTIDCIEIVRAIGAHTKVTVIDWKTGRVEDHSAQLRWYALAAARLFAVATITCRVVYVGQRHRTTANDAQWTLDAIDLDDELLVIGGIARTVRTLRALPTLTASDVHPGDHCRYCPALTHCPKDPS